MSFKSDEDILFTSDGLGSEKKREAFQRLTAVLRAQNERLREALETFTHPDLSKYIGGNVKGDDSIVFQRDSSILRIRDFRKAAALRASQPAPQPTVSKPAQVDMQNTERLTGETKPPQEQRACESCLLDTVPETPPECKTRIKICDTCGNVELCHAAGDCDDWQPRPPAPSETKGK